MSLDPLPEDEFLQVSYTSQGHTGRPRIEFDPQFLASALELRGSHELANFLNCSSRTVRHRALELQLAEPSYPVRTVEETPEGKLVEVYHPAPHDFSALSDRELIDLVSEALTIFPYFGNQLMLGYLRALGITVPRDRVRWALREVKGAPGIFGVRAIHRIKYQVPGPNSLWHHNGQHGLVRFKIIIHMFIDGYSRLVTTIVDKDDMELQVEFAVIMGSKMWLWQTGWRLAMDQIVVLIYLAKLINQDAYQWKEAWNSHTLSLRDERNRSPTDLWFFGMVAHGPRGLRDLAEREEEHLEHWEEFGIDWETMDNEALMEHWMENNQEGGRVDHEGAGVFVDPPSVPSLLQVENRIDLAIFESGLTQDSINMHICYQMWSIGLNVLEEIWAEENWDEIQVNV
ncbi:hypothetical protein FRC09_017930 [Ceratobasidium sp. 395]|nr:hypothetical protein FRC09_017930 [Ceratobasidium sp. 395]